jgi:hypothetical protein
MKSIAIGVVAFVLFAGLAYSSSGTAEAQQCGTSLTSDVNPSAVGQEVTFETNCLKRNSTYRVTIWKMGEGTIAGFDIDSPQFTYTFTDTGEYRVSLWEKRNRSTAQIRVAQMFQLVE